jgi:preprotein translocase subunit YajC
MRNTRIQCSVTHPARSLRLERNSFLPSTCGVFAVFISSAFAQTAPAAAAEGGGMMGSLTGMLPLVLMFVVLYFVMIRPQMKRQKEHRAMIDALAKGDEVATAGGLIGKVTGLSDGFVQVEISSGVEVQLQRSAVTQVLPKGSVK